MDVQEFCYLERALALRAHPDPKRGQAAPEQPAVEGSKSGAADALPALQALENRGVLTDNNDATQHIAVAAEVLGAAVHNDVDAEVEGVLTHWRRESVVTDNPCAALAPHLAHSRQVGDAQERIGGRLN